MSLSLLLVEDEEGIRDGLASFLQLKGYRVTVASSSAAGEQALVDASFDIVITDWHLGDGTGEEIARAAGCPVLVISGVTECVDVEGVDVEVIRKPVMPPDLVKRIEAMRAGAPEESKVPRESREGGETSLPVDAKDRVDLIRALVRARHDPPEEDFTVLDDGVYVTVQALLPVDDDQLQEALGRIGGDVRCLDRGGRPLVEVRFFRTGQRNDSDLVVSPSEPWPPGEAPVAVDFSNGSDCSPERFVELLDRARRVLEVGRVAYFLNVPTHLRLHIELLGKAHAMPMREMAGPALPAILTELWR